MKFKHKMNYANKVGINNVIIIGEDEETEMPITNAFKGIFEGNNNTIYNSVFRLSVYQCRTQYGKNNSYAQGRKNIFKYNKYSNN